MIRNIIQRTAGAISFDLYFDLYDDHSIMVQFLDCLCVVSLNKFHKKDVLIYHDTYDLFFATRFCLTFIRTFSDEECR